MCQNVYAALAKFQAEAPPIIKSQVVTKKNSTDELYRYASLDDILDSIRPKLYECGLGITQLIGDDEIETILFHFETGEEISSKIKLPAFDLLDYQNRFQTDGSKFSYYKRYALVAILGLSASEDNDGKSGDIPEDWVKWGEEQTARFGVTHDVINHIVNVYKNNRVETKETKDLIRNLRNMVDFNQDPAPQQKEVRNPLSEAQEAPKSQSLSQDSEPLSNQLTPEAYDIIKQNQDKVNHWLRANKRVKADQTWQHMPKKTIDGINKDPKKFFAIVEKFYKSVTP